MRGVKRGTKEAIHRRQRSVYSRFFIRSGIPLRARPAARIDWTLGMYIVVGGWV